MYVVVTSFVTLTNSVTLIVLRRGVDFRASTARRNCAAAPRVIGDVVALIVNDVEGHVAQHVVRDVVPARAASECFARAKNGLGRYVALYFTVSFTNTDTFCVVVMFSNSMTVS